MKGHRFDPGPGHPKIVVQTADIWGLKPRFRRPPLSADGEGLYLRVEEHVERFAWLAVDAVVGQNDQLVEEGLVGHPSQRVVDAHVDRVAVRGQGEAVVEVGLGLLVLDVPGVDLRVEERQPPGDPVLLLSQQIERDHAGVVGLEQLLALVAQRLAFGLVGLSFVSPDLVRAVKFGGDEFAERFDDVRGDLDAAVVVLDGSTRCRECTWPCVRSWCA
ncbi:MAG: hypothetical protein KIT69_01500 [Propionibacteriaceae bacterium]|nr:hypothetical protein [Propionibacteriaceae bacterium]